MIERKVAGCRVEFAFRQTAVNGIPSRARVEQPAALLHLGRSLQFLQKGEDRLVLLESEKPLGMFPS
jgi:hypothetical protein